MAEASLIYFDASRASAEFVELFLCVSRNSVARGSEAVSVTCGTRCDVEQGKRLLSTVSQRRTDTLMNRLLRGEFAMLTRLEQ